MSPAEGAAELGRMKEQALNEIRQKIMSKGFQVQNALRTCEIEVLTNESPSAPGSPPGVVTGTLRGTWNFGMSGGGNSLVVYGEPGAFYAKYLENGTRKMAARPFVDRITRQVEPMVMSIFADL